MKKIKEIKRLECFKELSKKEKEKILGGGLPISTSWLRKYIPYIMP